MKHKRIVIAVFSILMLCWPLTAYANSSWSWFGTTPLMVLPFAIAFTLAVEIFSVISFGKVDKKLKAAAVVTIANLLSFLVPYLFEIAELPDPSVIEAIKAGLYYIVTAGYLILTLIVELPVVFCMLRNDTKDKVRLLVSIVVSNMITTVLVAICERILCERLLY